jgi:prepilin-type processing-associated H-X9-DG protein
MSDRSGLPIRAISLTAAGVWLFASAVAAVLSAFSLRLSDHQELIFRLIFAGVGLALPSLLFSGFLVFALKVRYRLWPRVVLLLAAGLSLWLLIFCIQAGLGAAQKAARTSCQSNLELLAMATLMYTADHKDLLPPADSWVDATFPYVRYIKAYKCPADLTGGRASFAMNANLSGKNIKQIKHPERIILLFETDSPGANPYGGKEASPAKGRHQGAVLVAFADGHLDQFDLKTGRPPLEWKIPAANKVSPKAPGGKP